MIRVSRCDRFEAPSSLSSGSACLPRSIIRKPISGLIARVAGVPLDPFEVSAGLQLLPFLNLRQNVFYQILVLHWFACRGLPAVLSPIDIPICDAVDRILAVSDDAGISVARDNLERAQNRRELRALIRLPCSRQYFRYVSEGSMSVIIRSPA